MGASRNRLLGMALALVLLGGVGWWVLSEDPLSSSASHAPDRGTDGGPSTAAGTLRGSSGAEQAATDTPSPTHAGEPFAEHAWRVRVVREGKPVSGIAVEAWRTLPVTMKLREGVTDAQGKVEWPGEPGALPHMVVAQGNGTPARVFSERDTASVTWTLELGADLAVTGNAIDGVTGASIDGAVVWIDRLWTAKSDGKGRFHIPAGALGHAGSYLRVFKQKYRRALVSLPFDSEDQALVRDIAMFRGVVVTGTVFDRKGKPLPGATVRVLPAHGVRNDTESVYSEIDWRPEPGKETEDHISDLFVEDWLDFHMQMDGSFLQSDSRGRFQTDPLPAGTKVALFAVGPNPHERSQVIELHLDAEAEQVAQDFTMLRLAELAVSVTATDGEPIPDHLWVAVASIEWFDEQYVKPEGDSVEFRLPPGPAVAWAVSESNAAVALPQVIDVREGLDNHLTLEMEGASTIHGTVVDEANEPVPHTPIKVLRSEQRSWQGVVIVADHRGQFTYERAASASLLFQPVDPDVKTEEDIPIGAPVFVPPGKHRVRVVVSPRSWQRARITPVLPAGASTPNQATVTYRPKDNRHDHDWHEVLPITDGLLRVPHLLTGEGLLTVHVEGFAKEYWDLDLSASVKPHDLGTRSFRRPAAPLRLRVVDEHARPISGAAILSHRYKEKRTDQSGILLLSDLPKAPIEFKVWTLPGEQEYEKRALRLNPNDHRTLTVVLGLRLDATGQIESQAGTAVPSAAKVRMQAPARELPPGRALCLDREYLLDVDGQGRFHPRCGPGTWKVELILPVQGQNEPRVIALGSWEIRRDAPRRKTFIWRE